MQFLPFLVTLFVWAGSANVFAAPVVSQIDPCSLRIANLGKQQGARCRDRIGQHQVGPELVVIKTTDTAAFAITRSEISINDFNLYCTLYRRCAERKSSLLPVTGIDLEQARFYAQWLSRMTGREYRLPTVQEWRIAAQGSSGVADDNCLFESAGRRLRGGALRPVDQGFANGFGVQNLFGNAEEWVQGDSGVVLMGGAANMPASQCNAQYQNEQSPEAAGPFRGLRLVRELAH